MYVGLKQPRGDGERYVTAARAAAKVTSVRPAICDFLGDISGTLTQRSNRLPHGHYCSYGFVGVFNMVAW